MAKNKSLNIVTFCITLLTYQMLHGEGRQIKSLSRIKINFAESHSPTSIKKLGSLVTKSDHSKISSVKATPLKTSGAFPQAAAVNQNRIPSLEPAHIMLGRTTSINSFEVNKVDTDVQGNSCPGAKCLDNFQPTTLGHSSGAGHSYLPSHSLGVGHALKKDKRDPNAKTAMVENRFPSNSQTPMKLFSNSAATYTNDFRPTPQGRSPGAGHPQTNKKDTETTQHCLHEKCTDDFRSTASGDSTGAGHFFVNKSERTKTNQQGKHIGAVHLHAEQKEDYPPTAPGHSPGAGHAILKNN